MIELHVMDGGRVAVDPTAIVYVEERDVGCVVSLPHRRLRIREEYDAVLREIGEWYSSRRCPDCDEDEEDVYPSPEDN